MRPRLVAVTYDELVRKFFPEANISGFSHIDGIVTFYTQISAVLRPHHRVLDFGAGRGEPLHDDVVEYRRRLSKFQGRCAHLEGCDIDPVVMQNPFLDHAEVVALGDALPYDDNHFDIVISQAVFEHISEPDRVAQELLRVVKPGGLIAAITPNKLGYVGIAAQLVPNAFHVRVLKKIQPARKAQDIFPTCYLLNTPRALRKAFGPGAEVFVVRGSSEPAYYFGSRIFFGLTKWFHKYLPSWFQPILFVYVKKKGIASESIERLVDGAELTNLRAVPLVHES